MAIIKNAQKEKHNVKWELVPVDIPPPNSLWKEYLNQRFPDSLFPVTHSLDNGPKFVCKALDRCISDRKSMKNLDSFSDPAKGPVKCISPSKNTVQHSDDSKSFTITVGGSAINSQYLSSVHFPSEHNDIILSPDQNEVDPSLKILCNNSSSDESSRTVTFCLSNGHEPSYNTNKLSDIQSQNIKKPLQSILKNSLISKSSSDTESIDRGNKDANRIFKSLFPLSDSNSLSVDFSRIESASEPFVTKSFNSIEFCREPSLSPTKVDLEEMHRANAFNQMPVSMRDRFRRSCSPFRSFLDDSSHRSSKSNFSSPELVERKPPVGHFSNECFISRQRGYERSDSDPQSYGVRDQTFTFSRNNYFDHPQSYQTDDDSDRFLRETKSLPFRDGITTRSFRQRDSLPPRDRSFSRESSPGRNFSRELTPTRSFSRESMHNGSFFLRDATPERSADHKTYNSWQCSSGGRPFVRESTPNRSFQRESIRNRPFLRESTPSRSFNHTSSSCRSFMRESTPKRSFNHNLSSQRPFFRESTPNRFYCKGSPSKHFVRHSVDGLYDKSQEVEVAKDFNSERTFVRDCRRGNDLQSPPYYREHFSDSINTEEFPGRQNQFPINRFKQNGIIGFHDLGGAWEDRKVCQIHCSTRFCRDTCSNQRQFSRMSRSFHPFKRNVPNNFRNRNVHFRNSYPPNPESTKYSRGTESSRPPFYRNNFFNYPSNNCNARTPAQERINNLTSRLKKDQQNNGPKDSLGKVNKLDKRTADAGSDSEKNKSKNKEVKSPKAQVPSKGNDSRLSRGSFKRSSSENDEPGCSLPKRILLRADLPEPSGRSSLSDAKSKLSPKKSLFRKIRSPVNVIKSPSVERNYPSSSHEKEVKLSPAYRENESKSLVKSDKGFVEKTPSMDRLANLMKKKSSKNPIDSVSSVQPAQDFVESMEWETIPFEVIDSEIKKIRKTPLSAISPSEKRNFSSWDPNSSPNGINIYVVVDTNILLSALDLVKRLLNTTVGDYHLIAFIPWQVLSELDSLKNSRRSVSQRARSASSWLSDTMSRKNKYLLSQLPSLHSSAVTGFQPDIPDDFIILACLQLKENGHCVALLTNDKNLSAKGEASGVNTFSELSIDMVANQKHQNSVEVDFDNAPSKGQCSIESSIAFRLAQSLKYFLTKSVETSLKDVHKELWLLYVPVLPPWNLMNAIRCTRSVWDILSLDKTDNFKQLAVLSNIESSFKTNTYKSIDMSKLQTLLDECCCLANMMTCSSFAEKFILEANKMLTDIEVKVNSPEQLSLKTTDDLEVTNHSATPNAKSISQRCSVRLNLLDIEKPGLDKTPISADDSVSRVVNLLDKISALCIVFCGSLYKTMNIPWIQPGDYPAGSEVLESAVAENQLAFVKSHLIQIIEALKCVLLSNSKERVSESSKGVHELFSCVNNFFTGMGQPLMSWTIEDTVNFYNNEHIRSGLPAAIEHLKEHAIELNRFCED